MLDLTKELQTTDGKPVRVICTNLKCSNSEFSILIAVEYSDTAEMLVFIDKNGNSLDEADYVVNKLASRDIYMFIELSTSPGLPKKGEWYCPISNTTEVNLTYTKAMYDFKGDRHNRIYKLFELRKTTYYKENTCNNL